MPKPSAKQLSLQAQLDQLISTIPSDKKEQFLMAIKPYFSLFKAGAINGKKTWPELYQDSVSDDKKIALIIDEIETFPDNLDELASILGYGGQSCAEIVEIEATYRNKIGQLGKSITELLKQIHDDYQETQIGQDKVNPYIGQIFKDKMTDRFSDSWNLDFLEWLFCQNARPLDFTILDENQRPYYLQNLAGWSGIYSFYDEVVAYCKRYDPKEENITLQKLKELLGELVSTLKSYSGVKINYRIYNELTDYHKAFCRKEYSKLSPLFLEERLKIRTQLAELHMQLAKRKADAMQEVVRKLLPKFSILFRCDEAELAHRAARVKEWKNISTLDLELGSKNDVTENLAKLEASAKEILTSLKAQLNPMQDNWLLRRFQSYDDKHLFDVNGSTEGQLQDFDFFTELLKEMTTEYVAIKFSPAQTQDDSLEKFKTQLRELINTLTEWEVEYKKLQVLCYQDYKEEMRAKKCVDSVGCAEQLPSLSG